MGANSVVTWAYTLTWAYAVVSLFGATWAYRVHLSLFGSAAQRCKNVTIYNRTKGFRQQMLRNPGLSLFGAALNTLTLSLYGSVLSLIGSCLSLYGSELSLYGSKWPHWLRSDRQNEK